ncbi:MAG: tetratricopeptide repeat protein [Candidatus Aminicenantes bacterium]|nr:tetratricopeptide repeat protein [Candidatus Aminicenantes bacterium]
MRFKTAFILILCLQFVLCASSAKKIQQQREKDPRYHYNMGLFFLNNGNLDEATKYFNKCLSLNPGYSLAYNALGLVYLMKGQSEESINNFTKALKLNPKLTEAHNYMGVVYQETGLLDKAEQEFRIALADKNYQSKELPYFNLARLYFVQDKTQEALDYIEKSLEINKTFILAYNLKGTILEKMEKYVEAIKVYKIALKTAPEDININFNLAVAYFKNGEVNKAKEIFENIALKVTNEEMKKNIQQYLNIIKK